MAKITKIWAREILDSRAVPTVEAACQIDTGHVAVSSVPSGASTGTHEAQELRDKDPERYKGKGVLIAVSNVNKVLGPAVVGMDPTQQEEIDAKMISLDGTENKTKYGGNAILAISEVVSKIAAIASKQPLYAWINILSQKIGMKPVLKVPTSIFNMINGGLHGAGNLDFQEFHVIPATNKSFADGLRAGSEIYMSLGENLARRGAIHSVGDEGGYAPNLFTNADALEIVVESIRATNYSLGRDVSLGLDVAASVFYKNGEYSIRDKTSPMDEDAIIEYYKNLNSRYHLSILEDPLHEDAWESWKKLSALMLKRR
jgi:enolase